MRLTIVIILIFLAILRLPQPLRPLISIIDCLMIEISLALKWLYFIFLDSIESPTVID